MEKLEDIPAISRLSDTVVRILGQNPGKFTLQGTNTYLVGRTRPYILIDTGQGIPAYVPLLEQALNDAPGDGQDISDIVLTHKHHDHHGGLPDVLTLLQQRKSAPPPRVHKFPLAAGDDGGLSATLARLPPGSFTASTTLSKESGVGTAIHDLHDGQTLDAPGVSLTVLHTPGHTADSIALRTDGTLFTADTVLGQGTAVFEDLSLYMSSLNLMLPHAARLFPGHGPAVADGAAHIRTYIAHRQQREDEIVKLLATVGQPWTVDAIVRTIYAKYPESLWPAAGHGIKLHLAKLEGDGRVTKGAAANEDSVDYWELIST